MCITGYGISLTYLFNFVLSSAKKAISFWGMKCYNKVIDKLEFHKERIMVKEVKWTKYLWLSLLSFGAFMLELLSIFAIEVIFLHVDIQNYTMQ